VVFDFPRLFSDTGSRPGSKITSDSPFAPTGEDRALAISRCLCQTQGRIVFSDKSQRSQIPLRPRETNDGALPSFPVALCSDLTHLTFAHTRLLGTELSNIGEEADALMKDLEPTGTVCLMFVLCCLC
jgi:hypothetical protein